MTETETELINLREDCILRGTEQEKLLAEAAEATIVTNSILLKIF